MGQFRTSVGSPARVVFMGTGPFALDALEVLLPAMGGGAYQLEAVVTQPDRVAGRGQSVRRGEVARLATSAGIVILQPQTFKDDSSVGELSKYAPDLLVVASYGQLLPKRVLAVPRRGSLNLHPSLLPHHRGPSPVPGTILAGDDMTGVTVMEMSPRMDAGPIVSQTRVMLRGTETTATLMPELSRKNAELLLETLPAWIEESLTARAQSEEDATYTSLLTKDMARIDWNKPAAQIEREVRAFNPWPVSHTTLLDESIRIWSATAMLDDSETTPGTVYSLEPEGVRIQTGAGTLIVREVQPSGRSRMSAGDYARGRRLILGSRAS